MNGPTELEDLTDFLAREFYALDEECSRAGHHGFILTAALREQDAERHAAPPPEQRP